MDLTVIVPVYQGEKTIRELYNRIKETLDGKFDYEILFIYDSGKDNSWEIIQSLIGSDPSIVRGFRLVRNYGQHNALLFGLTKAHGDLIITMDEDLQHDPKFIPDLISQQKKGDYDVVYGKFTELRHSDIRIWTSEILRKILKIMIPNIYYDYSSYRLFKRSIVEKIAVIANSYIFIDGLLGSATENISSLPVKHYKRIHGESSYSLAKLFKHAMYIILSYTKIKTLFFLASIFFNLSAAVMYLINHEVNNHSISRLISSLLIIGFTLLFTVLITELIQYHYMKLNSKISEAK